MADYPTLRETIRTLGLLPGADLVQAIPLAWHAQQYRSRNQTSEVRQDTYVSRTSIFYAAAWTQPAIWEALGGVGLDRTAFIADIGLKPFSWKGGGGPADIPLQDRVLKAVATYKVRYPQRPTVDAVALAYAFVADREGRFQEYFERAGGKFDAAEAALERLLQTIVPVASSDAARITVPQQQSPTAPTGAGCRYGGAPIGHAALPLLLLLATALLRTRRR